MSSACIAKGSHVARSPGAPALAVTPSGSCSRLTRSNVRLSTRRSPRGPSKPPAPRGSTPSSSGSARCSGTIPTSRRSACSRSCATRVFRAATRPSSSECASCVRGPSRLRASRRRITARWHGGVGLVTLRDPFTAGGVKKVQFFGYTLRHSTRKDYFAFESADLRALTDGHVRTFERFGGSAQACMCDSQKPVVLRWEGEPADLQSTLPPSTAPST